MDTQLPRERVLSDNMHTVFHHQSSHQTSTVSAPSDPAHISTYKPIASHKYKQEFWPTYVKWMNDAIRRFFPGFDDILPIQYQELRLINIVLLYTMPWPNISNLIKWSIHIKFKIVLCTVLRPVNVYGCLKNVSRLLFYFVMFVYCFYSLIFIILFVCLSTFFPCISFSLPTAVFLINLRNMSWKEASPGVSGCLTAQIIFTSAKDVVKIARTCRACTEKPPCLSCDFWYASN